MAETPGITVKVNVDSKALREDVTKLLVGYTEWLNSQKLLDPIGDGRYFGEMVSDFFADQGK